TKTIGLVCVTDDDLDSARFPPRIYRSMLRRCKAVSHSRNAQRGIDRLAQRRIAERLEQAVDGALRDQLRTRRLAPVRGHENDRDVLSPTQQFAVEIRPAHSRHGDVEDETLGFI